MEIASKLQEGNEVPSKSKEMPEEGKVYAPILEARYKSLVEAIRRTGFKQVLEIASGVSLRGLAMSQNSEMSYVESDLAGINELKRPLIDDLRSRYKLNDFGNHHVVTANALERSALEAAASRLKAEFPLVVVSEGLLPYLSADERATLAGNVRHLFDKFAGGAWITPDFTTRALADDVSEQVKRFRRAILGATDRQLYEAAFESEEAINDFITEQGFVGVSAFQADLVAHLVSLERLGIKSQLVERLRPRMRIWTLSPRA
jgi:O-methyltransferase involved in polyketide biosynthesis